ncbi:AAEL012745-PA, partial [Aedes aegypti]
SEPPKNVLHGVLHLGQLKDVALLTTGGYFLVAHGFWSDEDSPILTTELSQDCKSFNYLITFPVMPNARFLERTKNQHMLVELWQKTPGATEKLVGVTRLPLHQFYIAFRDAQLAEHLSRAKLPVISIDGWSGITSPLAADPCGQVQAVLAIGTENQVEYLKLSRGLTHTSGDAPLRKTSDLLENLQRALAQRPSENVTTNLLPASSESASETPQSDPAQKQQSQAVNLPKVNVGKKFGKRNKNRSQGANQQQSRVEVEPSAYVTFEGYNLQPGTVDTVKSHEGIVYTTAVVEGCCNPSWKKKFDVRLPVDLMTNDEKRFILKVWRKAATGHNAGSAKHPTMMPAPMEDAVVGFTAVDLSVFLNGMPCILGWYNIMDFSGRCNGQIKGVNFQIPLSIDVDCSGLEAGNTSLSRALKRKFTELEEITQRLKARLFDVTGDENVDPDDEFERDLNTEAEEEDDEEWVDPLEDKSGQKRNSQFPNGSQQTRTTNTCSYTMSSDHRAPERSLTGCSDRSTQIDSDAEKHMLLEQLLKSHDLDTLINPKILKNLINPIMSTSESTPMSNPYENIPESESSGGTSADADMSEDSTVAVGGSTSDKVKLISSALQRTTISEDTTPAGSSGRQDSTEGSSKREAPEGEPMKVNDK